MKASLPAAQSVSVGPRVPAVTALLIGVLACAPEAGAPPEETAAHAVVQTPSVNAAAAGTSV